MCLNFDVTGCFSPLLAMEMREFHALEMLNFKGRVPRRDVYETRMVPQFYRAYRETEFFCLGQVCVTVAQYERGCFELVEREPDPVM